MRSGCGGWGCVEVRHGNPTHQESTISGPNVAFLNDGRSAVATIRIGVKVGVDTRMAGVFIKVVGEAIMPLN